MAAPTSHPARRRFALSQARAARLRKIRSPVARRFAAGAAKGGADALAQERHDRREQSVDRRRFLIAAAMTEVGASIQFGPLDTHAAVMKAVELGDAGYDSIILKDLATREELRFSAPIGPRN